MTKVFLMWIFICVAIVTGSTQDYYIDQYDVSVFLNENGDATITEEITCFFESKGRGIIRQIPLTSSPYGTRKKITIQDISVPNHPSKISTKNNKIHIRIGDPDVYFTGRQFYVIQYTVENAKYWEGAFYTFYYNVIGTEWDTDILKGSIRVKLPDEIAIDESSVAIFSGKKGNKKTAIPIRKTDDVLLARFQEKLSPGEGITVGFNYPEEAFDPPPPPVPFWKTQKWALIPAGLSLFLLGLWKRYGTRRNKEHIDIVESPPSDYNAAELGTFIDSKVQFRDILALIPEWGEMGYIKMQKGEEDVFIVKLNDLPADAPEYQKIFFNGFFESEDIVSIKERRKNMFRHTFQTQRALKKKMLEEGLYSSLSLKLFHSGYTITAIILCFVATVLLCLAYQFIAAAIVCIVSILLIINYNKVPQLSEKGKSLWYDLVGYKNHLKKYTRGFLGSTEMDHILPYLLIFQMDKDILNTLAEKSSGPSWFTAESGAVYAYHDYYYHWQTTDLRRVISTPPAATSSTSSGGGFSGGSSGGSVGGGMGGGGGSSW